MNREQDRLARLQRRHDHLCERVAQGTTINRSRDLAEASALKWGIAIIELALSNWPAGINAVREQEDQQ